MTATEAIIHVRKLLRRLEGDGHQLTVNISPTETEAIAKLVDAATDKLFDRPRRPR